MGEQSLIQTVQSILTTSFVVQLAGSVAIIIVLSLLQRLIGRLTTQQVEDPDKRDLLQRLIRYTAVAFGAVLLGPIWIDKISPVFTVLSLIAAALTITNKEHIINLTAWPVINWRRLFQPGDRVQIGTQIGDVVETGALYFTLSEVTSTDGSEWPTGRTVRVPNSQVLTQPVTNYSRGVNRIWHQMTFQLTAESRRTEAEDIVRTVAANHVPPLKSADRKRIKASSETAVYAETNPLVFTRIVEGKKTVVLRYLCPPAERPKLERMIWTDVLEQLEGREDVALHLA